MQDQPRPILWRGLKIKLLILLSLALLWPILAGLNGYALGNPPSGLTLASPCYHLLRADFFVPMWKSVPCDNAISAPSTAPSPSPATTYTPPPAGTGPVVMDRTGNQCYQSLVGSNGLCQTP
jgi:hypothetical protein